MCNKEEATNVFLMMVEEIKERIANGEELSDIEDESTELADSYVPVYNGRVLDAWKDMPAEYDDRGADELGATGGIFDLMKADLFLYYNDLVNDAIRDVAIDLEEALES